jgi:hypothetical protein
MWELHDLHAIRLTSAKANTLQQTQQPVLMPVLDLDRVLPILTPGFMETTNLKLLFKNNTCFTFNPKFAISLHMIRILEIGFLKITPVLH